MAGDMTRDMAEMSSLLSGQSLAVRLNGEPMQLLADRALYWPAQRRLLLADLHLGKGNVLRAAGIPVPTGGTAHDLQRIAVLLRATAATSLWILGDFLHGPRHLRVDTAWRAFREAHADVTVAVVRGNHDRDFDPGAAGVEELHDGIRIGCFVMRHAPPRTSPAGTHVLCGHLHPVLRLRGAGAHPLFWLQRDCTVLPAFSSFTGGLRVALRECPGSVICNGRALLRLGGNMQQP